MTTHQSVVQEQLQDYNNANQLLKAGVFKHHEHLQKAKKANLIPYFKVGARDFYKKEDVMAYYAKYFEEKELPIKKKTISEKEQSALNHLCDEIKILLFIALDDLEKTKEGQKLSAQRLRVNSLRLVKLFKTFRKFTVEVMPVGSKRNIKEESNA